MNVNFHIGMRTIKSLLAVVLSFAIWQMLRIPLPSLEVHPIFAYIYAIVEMRENPKKTKDLGLLRIKATVIGLVIGLLFLTASIKLGISASTSFRQVILEFLLLLAATFCSLVVSDIFKCENLCGIAAIITVICVISSLGMAPYLYAIMRALQTLIGVGAAFLINQFVANPKNKDEKNKGHTR